MRSSAHLAAINQTYLANYHKNLLDIVESEFSGDIKVLLKTILHSHINPIDYFAGKKYLNNFFILGRIYKACKGFGTNDKMLIRTLITMDEAYMGEIRKIYKSKYGMTLEAQISSETSGDYKKMLIEMCSH